jgi:hypothetical protein
MAETVPDSGKRAKARMRFNEDTRRLILSDGRDGLRDFPFPSPAPAHFRRRKPMYRPISYALEVLILCLLVAILVLIAAWVYFFAH